MIVVTEETKWVIIICILLNVYMLIAFVLLPSYRIIWSVSSILLLPIFLILNNLNADKRSLIGSCVLYLWMVYVTHGWSADDVPFWLSVLVQIGQILIIMVAAKIRERTFYFLCATVVLFVIPTYNSDSVIGVLFYILFCPIVDVLSKLRGELNMSNDWFVLLSLPFLRLDKTAVFIYFGILSTATLYIMSKTPEMEGEGGDLEKEAEEEPSPLEEETEELITVAAVAATPPAPVKNPPPPNAIRPSLPAPSLSTNFFQQQSSSKRKKYNNY